MNTDNILIYGSFLLTFLVMFGSKTAEKRDHSYVDKAIGNINQKFQNDLEKFYQSTAAFEQAVIEYKDQSSRANLKENYHQLRAAFKRVEFFVEYLDKQAFDKVLNGAPLPKLEEKVADLTILEPKGMQVIDELMGSDLGFEEIETLSVQAAQLLTNAQKVKKYLQVRKVTDRQFFEASRQAVIRLASLGITGFDTPGTQAGIEDAQIVLETQMAYFTMYKPELEGIGKADRLSNLSSLFEKGILDAKVSDFNSFNRLHFIKRVINPLYAQIKEIHLALDYETIDEVARYPMAVNYKASNLFEKKFLNEFYYVSIPENDLFEARAKLGKLLFYDPALSQNNQMACASCHSPEKAFTDGQTTSLSNKETALKRNAMTLNYSGYATGFFHDLRTRRLEDQFEHVVLSEDEFNSSYAEIMEKLSQSTTYRKLFTQAFPEQNIPIKSNNIDYALAAYVMKLSPFDNLVDRYFQDENVSLNEEVERGFNLFAGKANCATCHFVPLYSGLVPPMFKESEAEVLGVPNEKSEPWKLDEDMGRLDNGVTQEVAYFYRGSFKTPTIRNIEKTAPYMHNGVFSTLEEVMDFYNKGGGAGNGLKLDHQTLAPDPLNLTEEEISAIIAFMKSLNDETVFEAAVSLPKDFSDPEVNAREALK